MKILLMLGIIALVAVLAIGGIFAAKNLAKAETTQSSISPGCGCGADCACGCKGQCTQGSDCGCLSGTCSAKTGESCGCSK
jgi:hypothetical protein